MFRGRREITDFLMLDGVPDLFRAGISGDDAIEIRGKPERRLSAAGTAIPGQFMAAGRVGEKFEQVRGVIGAVARVIAGVA